jgi:alginate O-acetyltransferase complex protein AlgJ
MQNRQTQSPGSYVVSAVFALLLLWPAAFALTGHGGFDVRFIESTEHRLPFVAPPVSSGSLATGGWERDAERQFADAFPLRTPLIEGYDYTTFFGLRDSPSSMVVRGRDGWLFYGAEERDYLDGKPADDVIAHVADVVSARAAWCKAHGMIYVVLAAPNKSTVYARYLPDGVPRVLPSGLDRLFPLLRTRGVPVVDPRAALSAASANGEVYSRGDTHWNGAGAYVAYEATVEALRRYGVRDAIPRRAITARVEEGPADLLGLAGIQSFVRNRWVRYAFPAHAQTVDERPDVTEIAGGSAPTLVAFGDSFLNLLRPFLAESFRRAIFIQQPASDSIFDVKLLEREKPTIVIQEFVERNLTFGATFSPP